MRKFFTLLFYVFFTTLFASSAIAQSTTPNLNLNLPNFNAPGWGTLLNQNFSILDQEFPQGVYAIYGIQEEGFTLPGRNTLNFMGTGVTCGDDAINNRVNCTFTGGGVGSGHSILNEGAALADQPSLNFIGTGVDCVNNPGSSSTDCTILGHVIEDEGTPATQRSTLNFTGAGVTVSDSGGKTVVDIPAQVTEADPIVGAITGIVKADGAGNISAASADTDFARADADTKALADNVTAGFWAAATNAARTFQNGTGIAWTNPAGIAGNPVANLTTAYDCIGASATTQVLFNNAGNCDGIAGVTINAGTGVLSATGFSGPLTGNVTSSGQSVFTGSLLIPGKADPGTPITNELYRSTTAPTGLKWYDGATIQRALKDSDFSGAGAGLMNRTGPSAYSIMVPTDDAILIGSGTAWVPKILTTCRPSLGEGWSYDASTNTWDCENIVSSGLASLTEDANSVNSAKAIEVGIPPFVWFKRGAAVSTDRDYNLIFDSNVDVAAAPVGSTKTNGNLTKYNSAGLIVNAGPALKTCIIENDMQSASPLTNANLTGRCDFDIAVTLLEVAVYASSGTPSVLLERWRPNGGAVADVLTGALATGSAGAYACSKANAVAGIAGIACTNTLQNTALNAGDVIRIKSATAGGVATWHHIKITASY